MKKTEVLGDKITVHDDLSLTFDRVNGDQSIFSKEEMLEIADAYKGMNRIHKPFVLLFWTDVKNGVFHNWDLI